jgi:SAM-dependent methyltransferase
MRRVGWWVWADKPGDVFEERGALQWEFIKSLLPQNWSFDGKNVFDFGCGPGRILTPALAENPEANYYASDIYEPHVIWLREQLPAVNVMLSGEYPPLPVPDGHFDLTWAFSVYTHLLDNWSDWLVELHRMAKDDGLLVITIFGPGHVSLAEEPIGEDIIGMNVFFPSAPWEAGGPLIALSEWWIRAHWGRAFEILEIRPGDQSGPPPLFGQGVVVMRKKPGVFTAEDLERPEPGEDREVYALRQNIMSLRREVALHHVIVNSRSWTMTAPLRRTAAKLRTDPRVQKLMALRAAAQSRFGS